MKKRLLTLLLMGVVSISTGCGTVKDAATAIQSQGREYGQTYELKAGDTMSTAFFDLTVNSAKFASDIDGFVSNKDTDKFLVVNVTIQNTFDNTQPLPMSDSDFELSWNGADKNMTIFPEDAFTDNQLPVEYEIEKGGSKTGDLIYVVPEDASDFRIYYYDLWEDDFEGNTYWLPFNLAE